MSVLFIPDYSDGNPYQSNLEAALTDEVTYGRDDTRFPVCAAVLAGEVTVVHVHWLNLFFKGETRRGVAVRFGLLLLRILVIRIAGVPVVWTVHNVRLHEPEYPRLERTFKRWFVTSGTCGRLIFHCEAVVDVLFEDLNLPSTARNRVDVIPHGHYLDNYANDLSRHEARQSLDIPESSTVFLFFGLIRRYKGVDRLIDAFQAASLPDSRLLLAGNPVTDALEAELSAKSAHDDRIRCVFEFVPDDEIQRYMNAADAVVLPFRDVTTSGSAVLAMSFGNALVVPLLGCLPELLDENGAVFYGQNESDGLRSALERTVDRDLVEMGNYNETAVSEYDWSQIGEQTEAVYAKAL